MYKQKDFEYVRAVATTGCFTDAATKLFIAQPSLSRYIKDLEDDWGAVFFDRSTTPVQVTPAGKLFLEYADKIDALSEKLKTDLSKISNIKTFNIRLGVTFVIGEYVLPKILRRSMKQSPQTIVIVSKIGFSVDLIENLHHGNLDLAITGKLALTKSGHFTEILTYEPIMLVALKTASFLKKYDTNNYDYDHPLKIDFEDIRHCKFNVGKPNMTIYDKASEYLEQHGVPKEQWVEVASLPVNMDMALSGDGVSFIIRSMLKYSNDMYNQLLVPISCDDLNLAVCLSYNEEAYNNNGAMREAADWVRECLRGQEL